MEMTIQWLEGDGLKTISHLWSSHPPITTLIEVKLKTIRSETLKMEVEEKKVAAVSLTMRKKR